MPRRSERGFTLTELVVVIAIIGVLSTLIVSISSRTDGANARLSAEQVVSTVGLAKLRASATRKIQRVQIEPGRITVLQATTTGLVVLPSTEWALVQTISLHAGIEIWNVTASAVTAEGASVSKDDALAYAIDVRPDGQANASTVYISDGSKETRVIVYSATASARAKAAW
jgi:prepilin-type N-terminal cleavage/methylation domain-containing protein